MRRFPRNPGLVGAAVLGGSVCLLLGGCMWVTGVAAYFGVKAATDGGSGGSGSLPNPPPLTMDPGPSIQLEAKPQAAWIGDFLPGPDGIADGIADVVVVYESSGRIVAYQGDGRGILREASGLGANLDFSPALASAVLPPAGAGGTDGLLVATPRTLERIRWQGPSSAPEIVSTPLALDDERRDIAIGDFDGVGGPDVAVSSAANNWIEFFQVPEGAGDFVAIGRPIPVTRPLSICAADFYADDGLGIDDLAVLSPSGTTTWLYLYRLDGSWVPEPPLASKSLATAAEFLARPTADMSGDGIPDVAYTRGDGTGSAILMRPDAEHPTYWFDQEGRGGGHLSPDPRGLVLLKLPGGEERALDRATADARLDAIVVSYFKDPGRGHEVDSTVSYPLPGSGSGLSAGDLDGDGQDDLLALATGSAGYFLVPCLANPASADGVRGEPFHYVRGSFLGSRIESTPSLMDIGFGHAAPGGERPFLAAMDRVNEEVQVFFLDPATTNVVSTERFHTVVKLPAGILVRDFDLDGDDDLVVVGPDGFDLVRSSGDPEGPAFGGDIEPVTFLDMLRLDPRLKSRVTPAVTEGEEAAFLDAEFPKRKLREHVAAVSFDLHPAPDLAIPLATEPPGAVDRHEDYVVVVRNPAFRGSPFHQVQVLRTVDAPRQTSVANLNDDGALDLVVAGNGLSEVGLLFGDPSSPGSFFDTADAPLPPVKLPGLTSPDPSVAEVQTAASVRWDSSYPWPFVQPPLAEWLLASTGGASVIRYCRTGEEEVPGGWIPRFEPDFDSPVYPGEDTEAVYVESLFDPDGRSFDFAATDEAAGQVLLFRDAGPSKACRSWTMPQSFSVSSPQHFATVTLGSTFYLAVASRGAQEIELFRRDDSCQCFRPSSPVRLSSRPSLLPRGDMTLGTGEDGTPALILGVAGGASDRPFEVDVASLGLSAGGLTDLGSLSSRLPCVRIELATEGVPSALHLADLDADGVSDLLSTEHEPGSSAWVLKVHRGRTDGAPFERDGTAVLHLGEGLADCAVAEETSRDLRVLVASGGRARLVRIPKQTPAGTGASDLPAVEEWSSGSVAGPLRVAWGLRRRRSREPDPFVAILGRTSAQVECPRGGPGACLSTAGSDLAALGVRDLDGDGDDDLVVVDGGAARLRVYRSGGSRAKPSFGEVGEGVPFVAHSRAVDVGFLDANGDGEIDVAVGFETGEVLVFKGRGDGSVVEPEKLFASEGLWALRTCDVDGDGLEETILAACTTPGLVILAARPAASPAALPAALPAAATPR